VSEPYGYLWYTKHMERRFTHRKPTADDGYIGEITPVYTSPPSPSPIPSRGYSENIPGGGDSRDGGAALEALRILAGRTDGKE
jgi:hypothetical protein